MIISITAPTFDLDGTASIRPMLRFPVGEIRRRVNRVATLDGGVAVNDRGFSDGDRELSYTWRAVSRAHNDRVGRMLQLYAQLRVATPEGVFMAAPESFTPGASESSIRFLVISKLNQ